VTPRHRILSLVLCLCSITRVLAQIDSKPLEGLQDNTPRVHALVNARLVISPGNVIDRGTLVVRDGVIEKVGANVPVPPEARVWDLAGKTVYPGFIDLVSRTGLPDNMRPKVPKKHEEETVKEQAPKPETTSAAGSPSWNPNVTAQFSAANVFKSDPKAMEKQRALGFTALLVAPAQGIFSGSSALVDTSGRKESIIARDLTQHVSIPYTSYDDPIYPNSLMGEIALIRQTLLDADWYKKAQKEYLKDPALRERPAINDALAALEPVVAGRTPIQFRAEDELDLLRALKIADEFKVGLILEGTGYEYRVIDWIKNATIIVPINYPDPPPVETQAKALDVPLEDLEHWELAPSNLARVAAAGIRFAVTSDGLDAPEKNFWPNLRLAVRRGLSPDAALRALTRAPAEILGVADRVGTLERGKVANLVIASGDLFQSNEAIIESVWIDGKQYSIEPLQKDVRGTWILHWPSQSGELLIEGERGAPKGKLNGEDVTLSFGDRDQLILIVPAKIFGGGEGLARMTAQIDDDQWVGGVIQPDGTMFAWSAARTKAFKPTKDSGQNPREKVLEIAPHFPAGAFGRVAPPYQPEALLIKNATLWTCGQQGKIQRGALLIEKGRIVQVGSNVIAPQSATVIDAAGRNVTPGLIDCHSHVAISRGINESTSAVTCEVRVGDVLDPTDIALYRELSGGVTVANLLHGSANPIGGQSQIIKLRWGTNADQMMLASAPASVKFALGENPKRSNSSKYSLGRYPQTRMGVEQIFRDAFNAARDYENDMKRESETHRRRDLRLEAVAEVLSGKRMIHIHSYRQDEILMFIRLAQEYHLPRIIFHHALEGYKVADEIAKIKAGASAFSDWWGFKFEVYDAIPYNGAIMTRQGVLTSFNSDSNELARRLNVEAAKAVKYGGLTEEEALLFVTLNPAKQLGIDDRVGSLEAGKDADFVIWTDSPLSTFARVDETWIDGCKYFDAGEDKQQQMAAEALRERLIQRILPERQKAMAAGQKPKSLSAAQLNALHRRLYHNGQDVCNCSNAGL
jgi:imidazolonepropionase-like amidohydrolase